MQPSRSAVVVSPYTTQYRDPIVARAGERVTIGATDPEFPGWRWCTDARGKASWCPENLLESCDDGSASFLSDYTARELDVVAGERVTVERIESGWAWVIKSDGDSGWIPLTVIEST